MGIVDEDIRRVRDGTDIVGLISQHTQLKKTGQQWSGLCPFHNEKTASFSVNAERGFYYCFGCNAQGDAIDFIRETEGLDFVAAIETLAARSGITVRYTEIKQEKSRSRRKELTDLVGKAVTFYHEMLVNQDDPTARPARDYLRSRGYGSEIARAFSIGWAPDSWTVLSKHLKISDDDLVASGLGSVNKKGNQYDFFRARIVFPIFDIQGEAVGFGARKLPDDDGPKYKNTSDQCEVYSKSQILYGLNWAKSEAAQTDELVVCEGYTDVIGCHLSGVKNAVATCGTALTIEHVRQISRFAKRVVMAFDADSAGRSAAERVYKWEEEFNLQFAVVTLPPGNDPGTLASSDPEELNRLVSNARPYLEFLVDQVLSRADMSSLESRARVATESMSLVSQHPDRLVRDQYVMKIADQCMVSADEVRRLSNERKFAISEKISHTSIREKNKIAKLPAKRMTPEYQALQMLIQKPELIKTLSPWLPPVLFGDAISKSTLQLLIQTGDLHEARSLASEEVGDLLGQLAVQTTIDNEDEIEDEINGVICRLVSLAAERFAVELEARARQTGDFESYHSSISFLRKGMMKLRESVLKLDEISPLLNWLVENEENGIGV